MNLAVWHLQQTSEMLAFLATVGVAMALIRIPGSAYKQYLAAFALVMLGAIVRESAVYFYGASTWGEVPLLLSAVGRDMKILGTMLFIRAVTHKKYGEKVWMLMLAASMLFAAVVS